MAGASLGGNMLGGGGGTQQPMNPSTPLGTGAFVSDSATARMNQPAQRFSIKPPTITSHLDQAANMLTQQQANPQYSPGMAPGVNVPGGYQTSFNTGPAVDTGKVDAAGMPVQSVGNASPYMKSMEDAYYQRGASRLDPQYQERQGRLESQLASMGLTRGSEAWTNEMDRMGRDRNDAYSGLTRESILNSGAEAQRAQGMDIASGNFANTAAQQDYMNQLKSQEAFNAAQGQNFGQNQAAAQFGNTALSEQQKAAQGWGALDVQSQASRNQLAGSLAGTEANRYGSDQQLKGAEAQASATSSAGQAAANASMYASDQQRLNSIGNNQTTLQNTGLQNSGALERQGLVNTGQLENTGLQNTGAYDRQKLVNTGNVDIANIGANTSRYTSDNSLAGSMYGTNAGYTTANNRLNLDTNQQNFSQGQTLYNNGLNTQAALGGNMLPNPSFGNVPGAPSGNTQPAGATGKNSNGRWVNAIGQVWSEVAGTWGGG